VNRSDVQANIMTTVARSQRACADLIEHHMRQELERIHRAHFGRHTLHFFDAMGSICIWLDEEQVDDILRSMTGKLGRAPLEELVALKTWYCEMGDLAHVSVEDIKLEPIR
jgi:hypothetical protein